MAGSGTDITGTLTNPLNTAQTAIYTVTPVSPDGPCTGSTFTVTVTVNPMPAINNLTSAICSSGSFNVTPINGVNGLVPVGISYSWTPPAMDAGIAGGIAGSGASITGTLTNSLNTAATATYTVTPATGSCTGTPFTITVTVNPKPAINDQTAVICSGGSFTIAPVNTTDGLVPAGTLYTWAAPSVTGGITGGAAGTSAVNISGTLVNPTNAVHTATYTVTPVSGTCTGSTFTVTVTVNPMPAVNNLTSTICSGGTFTVTPANGTNGIVPAGTTYSWGVPTIVGTITPPVLGGSGASITGTLTNTGSSSGTATYTVTPESPAGPCTGATFTVTVTVNPMPAINNFTPAICSGGTFTVNPVDGTDGIIPSGTTYTWTAPTVDVGVTGGTAGTNAASISGTLTNSTSSVLTATYSVTPKSGSCTGTPFTITVTVNPNLR